MSEVKKCPKCGGEMEQDKGLFVYGRVFRLTKKGDVDGDRITPFYFKDCGYIEFYNKLKEKKEQAMSEKEYPIHYHFGVP
jgi:predicted nucleic-acid-binding Zn-ribbon protein